MKKRTVGSIALGPTGNLQGGIRFYSLCTGRILQRDKNSYTPLKMRMTYRLFAKKMMMMLRLSKIQHHYTYT
jgi:hypothetical protein